MKEKPNAPAAKKPKEIPVVTVETLPLSKLKPAKYNPREIDPESLAGLEASLDRFGVVEPLVWNRRTGNLVGGHQRLKVLKKRRVQKALVSVVDLSEIEEKALNVTLNNRSIQGRWTEGLADILPAVKLELPEFYSAALVQDLEAIVKDLGSLDAKASLPERDVDPKSDKKTECPKCGHKF